uniref:Putative secreted protein n=1 Tax=Rhipicephalus microplus TaxID=6941 RepID=A0A6G5A0G3_RHIMP
MITDVSFVLLVPRVGGTVLLPLTIGLSKKRGSRALSHVSNAKVPNSDFILLTKIHSQLTELRDYFAIALARTPVFCSKLCFLKST